jgi:hypothetical protein
VSVPLLLSKGPCHARKNWFLEHNLDLPVKGKDGETAWRRPNYATIHRMVENPIYGGTYAYGKTAVVAGYDGTGVKAKIRHKARSDWLALMPNAHEGYVSWEKAEAIKVGERLTDQSVSDIVKKHAERLRLDPKQFAGHSFQAAIIFSFVIGIASRKVCIGVLPKHQRP